MRTSLIDGPTRVLYMIYDTLLQLVFVFADVEGN